MLFLVLDLESEMDKIEVHLLNFFFLHLGGVLFDHAQ